jgi:hypothetical protein
LNYGDNAPITGERNCTREIMHNDEACLAAIIEDAGIQLKQR